MGLRYPREYCKGFSMLAQTGMNQRFVSLCNTSLCRILHSTPRILQALPGTEDLGKVTDGKTCPFDPFHSPTVGDVGGDNGGAGLGSGYPFKTLFNSDRSLGT